MKFYALFLFLLTIPFSFAEDFTGTIYRDKVTLYADTELTKPIGFMAGGKKVTVAPNESHPDIYSVLVPGKKAYIKKTDVLLSGQQLEPELPRSERFARSTRNSFRTKYVASYYKFDSTVDLRSKTSVLNAKKEKQWTGVSLKGEVQVKLNWDAQVIGAFMSSKDATEEFRAFELGMGVAYRVIDAHRFLLRLETQILSIPFTSFEISDETRKNSYGYTVGAGVNSTFLFSDNWGVEAFFGMYQTSLLKFQLPAPYGDVSPVFTGIRLGIGVNYQF